MAAEIELKLAVRADAPAGTLAAVMAHPALMALRSGEPHTAQLVSTYYDTPTRDLYKRGLSIRVRQTANAWQQTVKDTGSAVSGLHARNEYQWPLAGPRIDAKLLSMTPWAREFAAAIGRVKPVFRTLVARTEAPIVFADGTRAMVCLDQGMIRASRKRSPIAEIEMELIDGNVERLYDLAIALLADLPLSIATATKAERGFALAWSIAATPRRARVVPLARDIDVGNALAALGGECLAQAGANAEAVAAGLDPDFLHQLRVALRRLRSLLRVVVRATSKDAVAPLVDELRWLTGVLGPARDWDVFATETLAAMAAHVSHPRQRREVGTLRARITRVRRLQQRAAMQAVASSRFSLFMMRAAAFFHGLPAQLSLGGQPPERAIDFARAMLQRRHRAVRKRGKRLRRATPMERHEVRIAAKQLRYAAEFFAPVFADRRARQYVDALARLQGVLGRLNDLVTAKRLLDELAPPDQTPPTLGHAVGMARGWIAATEQFDLAPVDKTWTTFTKRKPFWD